MEKKIARAEIDINAPKDKVWNALVNPVIIKQYMFGTTVTTDWQPGSKITWSGEWEGKPYQDKGELLEVKEGETLRYTHYSPLSKDEDKPENYHTIAVHLSVNDGWTHVTLTQDGSKSAEAKDHSEKNWKMILEAMKKVVEG